jgi:hypothetical protein
MKENRKIEELILMFATTSTTALKKDPQLADEGWKVELNNQVAQFIRILRDCLRNVHHVNPELTARLEMYTSKLAPQSQPGSTSDSASTVASSSRPGESSTPALTMANIPLANTVATLFRKSQQDALHDLNTLRRTCTEKVHIIHFFQLDFFFTFTIRLL